MTAAKFNLKPQTIKADGSPSIGKRMKALAVKFHAAQRIVVLTGAGISCSAGIPVHFGSAEGFYNLTLPASPCNTLPRRQPLLQLPTLESSFDSVANRMTSCRSDNRLKRSFDTLAEPERESHASPIIKQGRPCRLLRSSDRAPATPDRTPSIRRSTDRLPFPKVKRVTATPSKVELPTMKGKDLSDARILRTPDGIKTHLIFLNNLKCASDEAEPTETHRMIKRMHDRGALARIYTQNNDGLEGRAGLCCVPADLNMQHPTAREASDALRSAQRAAQVVQLHGSWAEVVCSHFAEGQVPACTLCEIRARDRAEQSKRRAGMLGSVRPAITLHGGSSISPDWDRSIGEMAAFDRSQRPDMIPVMGTSLKVHGFRVLLRDFAQGVGNVLVNRIDVATGDWAEIFDHVMLGASDDFARQLQLLEPIKTSATVENASLLSVTARAVIDLTLDD